MIALLIVINEHSSREYQHDELQRVEQPVLRGDDGQDVEQ